MNHDQRAKWPPPQQEHRNGRVLRQQVQPASVPRLLLTKREAAAALGMSVRHFERHVQAHVRCVHSGQLTLYPIGDLERWALAESTVGGRVA
jgi:hypothetical protein